MEIKRWNDLKEQEKKSEEELKKLLNLETFKAQALKWEEHENKKSKMLNKFTTCISKRTNPLPITKISYIINSQKEVDIIKKTENQAKMTKLSMEWKRLCKIRAGKAQ
ncbi:hypothetical protein Tco_0524545 [Tanacetum coccineum]